MYNQDDSYVINNIDVIYQSLYLPSLTDNLVSLISLYIDTYHRVLNVCLENNYSDFKLTNELNILSGPINEIYHPNNHRINDGNTYPAVNIILGKIEEYASGLEKGFTRILNNPNTPSVTSDNIDNNLGFLNLSLVLITVFITSIFLIYLLIILK